jgi:uncharacterized protein (TIGR01777 family)
MNVAVTGASGFVGARLVDVLRRQGHTVRAVSLRNSPLASDLARELEPCEAVIHLAGEPVAQRWTARAKERIRASRIGGTRALVEAMAGLARPLEVLISASAIGYYGSRGEEILTEDSPPADDFLARLAVEWESEARAAERAGTRVVSLRIGVVLGQNGGALAKMLLPFRLGVGGRIGNGTQWMSWIHLDDLVALMSFLLPESTLRGVFNATSPHPVRNTEFTRELAHAVHRPAIFPVPSVALKLLYGEMAGMILGSQRVEPQAALRAGFEFSFPEIGAALRDVLK